MEESTLRQEGGGNKVCQEGATKPDRDKDNAPRG